MSDLDRLVVDEVAAILTGRVAEPPAEPPAGPMEQLHELVRTIAIEPLPPRRTLEVGWLAGARLRMLGRAGDGPVPRRFTRDGLMDILTGIPVVQRQSLPADAWRLMEGDTVIDEGTLTS